MKVKLVKVDDSLAIVFTQEMLEKLEIREEDVFNVVDTPEGFLVLNSMSELSKDLDSAEKIMKEDKSVLNDLSDS